MHTRWGIPAILKVSKVGLGLHKHATCAIDLSLTLALMILVQHLRKKLGHPARLRLLAALVVVLESRLATVSNLVATL